MASRFGFVLALSLPLSFLCQSLAQDKGGITVGATNFTAAEVALAKQILKDHAARVKEVPELEKVVDSLRKAKIVPAWNSTYEKLGPGNVVTPFGRNKKKPDEYVIVGKNTKTANQVKERAIKEAEARLEPVKSRVTDFDERQTSDALPEFGSWSNWKPERGSRRGVPDYLREGNVGRNVR